METNTIRITRHFTQTQKSFRQVLVNFPMSKIDDILTVELYKNVLITTLFPKSQKEQKQKFIRYQSKIEKVLINVMIDNDIT
jgi:hypothetical protein